MSPHDPAAYGQTHAPVYDLIYGDRFDPAPAVAALAAAAGSGTVLVTTPPFRGFLTLGAAAC